MHIQNCEINKYTIKKCLYLIVSKKTITFAGKKSTDSFGRYAVDLQNFR